MRTSWILIACCTFVVLSCKNRDSSSSQGDSAKLIKLDLSKARSDSMNLSVIAERIEYIPLERTDQAILGHVYDFEITDDYFFIDFEKDLFRFGSDGKFLNRIYTKGRGPAEVQPVCSAISKEDSLVYVCSWDRTLKTFDFNGNYVTSITRPINPEESLPPWRIGCFNNTLFVSVAQGPWVKYIYSCYDIRKDTLYVLYKNIREYKDDQSERSPAIIPYDYHYQINEASILFKEKFSDTIFSANREFEVTPRYIIDFTNDKLTWEVWRDNAMFDISGGPPAGYWMQSFCETNRFLFLMLVSHKGPQVLVTCDKNTGAIEMNTLREFKRAYTRVYLKNDVDNLIPFAPVNENGYFISSGNCLYSIIDGEEFARYYRNASGTAKNATKYLRQMAPVLDAIDEFSNPVIMKVYLR
ncbi:MAG: 6-bladed beta-propeller [Bacteroidales bacterium]